MRLTTARYYTPSGRSIQAKGIEPDIVVEQAKIELIAEPQFRSEAELPGALQNIGGTAPAELAERAGHGRQQHDDHAGAQRRRKRRRAAACRARTISSPAPRPDPWPGPLRREQGQLTAVSDRRNS